VARLLATVGRRIIRLVARHGIDLANPSAETDDVDPRQLESPAYAAIQGAAVLGGIATGARAGARVMRMGATTTPTDMSANGELHATGGGFDLHAAVAVPAGDRERLEHLCRYVLRPPLAENALECAPDGTILLRLRRRWRDGTWAVRFRPTELLEKLAAMIPKPRINLLVYHGEFAPHARGRAEAVRGARERTARKAVCEPVGDAARTVIAPGAAGGPVRGLPAAPEQPPPRATAPPYVRPTYYRWADLLRRTFAIDVLECPECGGRLRLLATIAHPPTIAAILRHLGLPGEVPAPTPARQAEWWT
jgi:hypothetical protein